MLYAKIVNNFMTAEIKGIYFQALTAAGLSKEQSQVYEPLIQKGPMQAGRLSRLAGLSRPYVYKILEELVDLGVVTKEEPPDKPAQFVPMHPFAVLELFRKRQKEIEIAGQTVQGIMGALISDYTLSSRIPGIRILPGMDGVAEMYQDILHEGKDICLIRSTLDDDRPERMNLVLAQIEKQVERGIHTRIIGPEPTQPAPLTIPALLERDRTRLTTRRILPREEFTLPAQIMMYGNKVAITAYQEPLITTVIENEAIRTTMGTIFELVWNIAKEPKL